MPKLQAKGRNEYVTMSKVPTEMAKSESAIVFAAFRSAVDGLLEQVNTPGKSEYMEKHCLKQMILMEALYKDMETDLKRVALVLAVVKQKLNSWETPDDI